MVLIQDVDAIPFLQFIFHQPKYVDVSGALFGIAKTKEMIPSPKVCFNEYTTCMNFIILIILYLWYFLITLSQFSSFVTRMQMKSVYQQIIYLVETKTLKVYLDRYPIAYARQFNIYTNYVNHNQCIIALLAGEQYRTVSCLWGNASCPAFQNEQQTQDICKDPNIRDNFCRTKYTSSWEPWPNYLKIREQNTNNIRHI